MGKEMRKPIRLIHQLLFVISGLLTTINFFVRHEILVKTTLLLSLLILALFARADTFNNIHQKIKTTKGILKVAILAIAGIVSWSMTTSVYDNAAAGSLMAALNIGCTPLQIGLLIGSTLFIFYYLSWFYLLFLKRVYCLLKVRINFTRKRLGITLTLIGSLLLVILFLNNITTVFFNPGSAALNAYHQYDGWFLDVIFQTDTDPLFPHYNVFIQDVPSLRQPLFSLFSFPLVAPLYGLSYLLFFIPHLYPTLVIWLQFLLVFTSAILIYDIARDKLRHPKLFLAFYLSTYGIIIFPLILERFIFGLFYLILAIYLYDYHQEKRDVGLIGAMGTNLLSFLMVVLLTLQAQKGSLKERLFILLKCLGTFFALMIVFGRLPLLFYFGTFQDSAQWMTLEVGWTGQLQQFSEFVFASFVFPETMIDVRLFPRYEQAIVTQFNGVGLAILAACVIATVKNFKDFLTKVSFYWFSISFLLLGILGWSTSQHNLILFSPLFSFSFVYLFYLFLEQVLERFKGCKQLMSLIIAILLLYNIYGLVDLLSFAFTYYPTGG